LESEELSLKHKILALEEQRQRVLSLTRELIKQSPIQIAHLPIQSGSEYDELEALVRAANGEKVNPEELLASLTRAIEMICKTLDNNSITRKIMEHAKLSLKHEPKT
jgi:predicted translin family RNA/ssDNA-binding protein